MKNKTLDEYYVEVASIAASMRYHNLYQKVQDFIRIYKLGKKIDEKIKKTILKHYDKNNH